MFKSAHTKNKSPLNKTITNKIVKHVCAYLFVYCCSHFVFYVAILSLNISAQKFTKLIFQKKKKQCSTKRLQATYHMFWLCTNGFLVCRCSMSTKSGVKLNKRLCKRVWTQKYKISSKLYLWYRRNERTMKKK